MSGGSMNYLYGKVLDAEFAKDTPARKAFGKHLKLVAKALRAIEWNDSGDGDDSEDEAIRACLSRADVLDAAIQEAHEAAKALRLELERACAGSARITAEQKARKP